MNGSFWNMAATATIGTFSRDRVECLDHVGAHVELDAPGGEQQALLVCGPPCRIVTSSPYLA